MIIQNFVPGVAKKLGIDYETLSAINPRLIFVSSTAFGEVAVQKRKGFDIIAHAASGIMSNYAERGRRAPRPGAINYIDIGTGVFNALGIVSALYHPSDWRRPEARDLALQYGAALQAQNLVHIDERTPSSTQPSSS